MHAYTMTSGVTADGQRCILFEQFGETNPPVNTIGTFSKERIYHHVFATQNIYVAQEMLFFPDSIITSAFLEPRFLRLATKKRKLTYNILFIEKNNEITNCGTGGDGVERFSKFSEAENFQNNSIIAV